MTNKDENMTTNDIIDTFKLLFQHFEFILNYIFTTELNEKDSAWSKTSMRAKASVVLVSVVWSGVCQKVGKL